MRLRVILWTIAIGMVLTLAWFIYHMMFVNFFSEEYSRASL